MIRNFFIILLSYAVAAPLTIRKEMKNAGSNFDKSGLFEKYVVGDMGIYIKPKAFVTLMN
jgi:hypothetical protein